MKTILLQQEGGICKQCRQGEVNYYIIMKVRTIDYEPWKFQGPT